MGFDQFLQLVNGRHDLGPCQVVWNPPTARGGIPPNLSNRWEILQPFCNFSLKFNSSKFFQKSGSLSEPSQPPNISNSLKLLGSGCFRNLTNANTRTLQNSESVRHCCKLPKRRSFTSIQNSNTPLQLPKLTRRATMKASFRAGRNTQTTRSLKHKSSGKDIRNLVPVIFLMFFVSQ